MVQCSVFERRGSRLNVPTMRLKPSALVFAHEKKLNKFHMFPWRCFGADWGCYLQQFPEEEGRLADSGLMMTSSRGATSRRQRGAHLWMSSRLQEGKKVSRLLSNTV